MILLLISIKKRLPRGREKGIVKANPLMQKVSWYSPS